MPKALDQRPGLAAENEDVADERIPLKMLLHEQRETGHAFVHIRVIRGDPDPNPARNRNRRSASIAALTIDTVALAPIDTRAPIANSTMIARSHPGLGSKSPGSSTITAGTNWPSARPSITSRRHL
jgi:hypothetical protein